MTISRPLRIGLTGGIASGKSTVAEMLRHMGAVVIDTDQIAREVVRPGSTALQALRQRYGDAIFHPDGALHRERLAEIVFASPEKKNWLEQLLHPLIKERADELAQQAVDQGAEVVVFDVPLLFESGWVQNVDLVWVVYVPPTVQRQRLKLRDGFSDASVSARLAAQWPIDEKAARADLVIDNTGTQTQTRQLVETIWQTLSDDQANKELIDKGRDKRA